MSCDATCRGCRYSSVISAGICCDYYLVHGVGNRRGCKAGKGCTKREAGPKAQTIEQKLQSICRKPAPKKAHKMAPEDRKRYRDKVKAEAAGKQYTVLEEYRKTHNTTYAQMARDLGISPKTMGNWVAERCRAKWDKLAVLGIPADMCFCSGDGRHQTFRTTWERTAETRYYP